MHEVALTGGGTKVQVTVSLSLPAVTPATMQTIAGTPGQYVGGYVFLDENAERTTRCRRAGAERGHRHAEGVGTQPTAADGSYTFSSLAPGSLRRDRLQHFGPRSGIGYTERVQGDACRDGTVVVNSVPTTA